MQLSPSTLTRLETEFERQDPRRTGTVNLELFQEAFARAKIPAHHDALG